MDNNSATKDMYLTVCTQCKDDVGNIRVFLNIESLAEIKNKSGQFETIQNSLNSINECLCEECFNEFIQTLKPFFDKKKTLKKSRPSDIE